jgi:hypothetical protein
MKETKLWQVLETLGERERVRLADYLDSPFFGAPEAVSALYMLLLEDGLRLEGPVPDKTWYWERLHPDRPYADDAFRTLCSQLLRQVEGFFTHLALQRQPATAERLLLDELERRRMDRHLRYVLRRARKALDASPLRDEDWSLARYRLERAQYRFDARQERRSQKLAPVAAAESVEAFYLASRLRLACELRNLQHILRLDHDVRLPGGLRALLDEGAYAEQPAVALYSAVWSLLEDDSPERAYRVLRERIERLGASLPAEDQHGLYIYAVNFCIRQANRGETRYLVELLDLYREALQREVLFQDGELAPSTYKNIVTVALRVDEYDWTRDFIRRYRTRLPADKRRNAYTYNLAKYYFTVRRYDDVLPLLREVEYDDVFYALDAKVMLLKVYYETGEADALHSLFESFAVFLRRNKVLSAYHKTVNLNFIKFTRRLHGIPTGDKDRLRALRERIEVRREVADINWLLDRIRAKEAGRGV